MNEIIINLDKKCAECHKGTVTPNGLCLGCTEKALHYPMKSEVGKAVAARWKQQFAKYKR